LGSGAAAPGSRIEAAANWAENEYFKRNFRLPALNKYEITKSDIRKFSK
jgi:hypothetical protein